MTRSAMAGSDTPTTWRVTRAGLASGPRKLNVVGMPSSLRAGPTKRIAGWNFWAKQNPMPASSMQRATPSGPRSMTTPSSSSRSAEPHADDAARLPCFATADSGTRDDERGQRRDVDGAATGRRRFRRCRRRAPPVPPGRWRSARRSAASCGRARRAPPGSRPWRAARRRSRRSGRRWPRRAGSWPSPASTSRRAGPPAERPITRCRGHVRSSRSLCSAAAVSPTTDRGRARPRR